jgi:8-oxo-dGTP diphosphatase
VERQIHLLPPAQRLSAKLTDYLCSFDYRSQSGRLTRQLNFIAQCDDIKNLMIDNREHEGYTWLGSNELERYNISQETKSVIKTYFLRRDLEISPTEKMLEAWNQGIEGIVVGGVISQNDKVLLLKRANSEFNEGIYELPSGKLQKGESIEMGIVRKVKAETDLDVSRINKQLPHFDYRSSEGVLTRQLNYEIKANETSPIKLSLHHEGFTWAHAVELAAYPISKEVRSVVEGLLPKKHPAMAPAIKEQGLFKNKRGRDEEVNEEVNFKKANNVERKL